MPTLYLKPSSVLSSKNMEAFGGAGSIATLMAQEARYPAGVPAAQGAKSGEAEYYAEKLTFEHMASQPIFSAQVFLYVHGLSGSAAYSIREGSEGTTLGEVIVTGEGWADIEVPTPTVSRINNLVFSFATYTHPPGGARTTAETWEAYIEVLETGPPATSALGMMI